MRPASEAERRRLNETFAALCAIASPSGSERACADAVIAYLREIGLDATEDDTSAETGADCGNLLVRIPSRREGAPTILLAAHMDTVAVAGPIEPVVEEGLWINRHDAILGADNKLAVAVLVELARRVAVEGSPVGLELALHDRRGGRAQGRRAFDISTLQSTRRLRVRQRAADRRDRRRLADALPLRGDVPRHRRPRRGAPGGRAGRRCSPPRRPSPRCRPAGSTPRRRRTSRASAAARSPRRTSSPTAARSPASAARSTTRAAEATLAAIVDAIHDAANDPANPVDVDVTSERHFRGYRLRPGRPGRRRGGARAARLRLRRPSSSRPAARRTRTPSSPTGCPCVNLANGTERNHQPDERVSVQRARGDARRRVRAAGRVRRGGPDLTCRASSASTARPSTRAASSTSSRRASATRTATRSSARSSSTAAPSAIVVHDDEHLWLVRQPREATCATRRPRDPGRPAGRGGRVAAGRGEARARRGARPRGRDRWSHMTTYYTSAGFTNEEVHVYLATGLREVEQPETDEDERIEIVRWPLARPRRRHRRLRRRQDAHRAAPAAPYDLTRP